MRSGIYFVGGASGAGKTTATRALAAAHGVAVIDLDDVQRLLMPAIPVLEARIPAMRALARSLVDELVRARACAIVEGGWIEPDTAADLRAQNRGAFHPVYCGFRDNDVGPRLAELRATGAHWLAREPEEVARAFLLRQCRNSETVRTACARLEMPYCDFTSRAAGAAALQADFERWLGAAG